MGAPAPSIKTQNVIHIVAADGEFLRTAEEAFATSHTRVEAVSDWTQVSAEMANVVLVCDEQGPTPIECLVKYPGLRHVLMKNDRQSPQQLQALASKMRGGDWGIGAYLTPGTFTQTVHVTDYGKKKTYIDQIRDYVAGIPNGFNDLPTMAATVAWELIMNGLFNAPRTGDEPKYREVSRRRDLVVEPEEAVELTFGYDERSFVIAASDAFGALTRDTVVQNLERASRADRAQIRRTTQGAGVGLYVLFTSASQLDIQVAPGERTDVTAIFYLSKRFKDFERRGHSINFFIEESQRP